MKINTWATTVAFILAVMFFYAGFSKMLDFEGFQVSMRRQPFHSGLMAVFIWILPPLEIVIGISLFIPKYIKIGFCTATIVMAMFTIYSLAILFGFFKNVPCSCGGIIQHLSWQQHLIFNSTFLFLALLGSLLTRLQNTNKKFRATSD